MSFLGRNLLVFGVTLTLGFLASIVVAAEGAEESFREGIRAGDLEKWGEAAELMAAAIGADPAESKKRVALSGVFSSPYVPHFYRGWFLYKQGTDRCGDALRELEISEEQGVVLTFKKQREDLEEVRQICGARVLPPAIESAAKTIADLEDRLDAPVIEDSGLQQRQRRVREKLVAAKAILETGRTSFRLRPVDRAQANARSLTDEVAAIEREAAGQSQGLLEAAMRSAERSLALAEREQQALTAALDGLESVPRPAGLASPEEIFERLEAMRQILTTARRSSDLAAVQKLREEADSLRSKLESSRTALADAVAAARKEESIAGSDDEEAVQTVVEVAGPTLQNEPAQEPAPLSAAPPVDRSDPSLVAEVRRLTESADLFLQRIGAGESNSELLELQRSRLSNLVFEARGKSVDGDATTSALEALLGRLSDSLSALQLIVGAQAYFSGNPQQAIELLNASEPPASSLGAHFYLFLSASRFALFQVGLSDDTGQAAADARRCRELAPDLAPDPQAFSPGFRQFFRRAVAQ